MIPHSMFHRMIVVIGLAAVAACSLAAQVRVTLNVTSRPNPYLSAWSSRRETAMLTVTVPPGTPSFPAKFKVEVKKDGAVQARTKLEKMAVVTIPGGPSATTYFAEQLLPFSAIDFADNVDKTALRSGMLAAGDYEFCVDLVDPVTGASLIGAPACKPFYLTSYQAPVLLLPENNAAISRAGARPTFRWTPVSPKPPGTVHYRVMIFEVLPGQATMQAFKSNRPIVDREVLSAVQLLWPPDFQLPGRVTTYIWSVRATDDAGNPLGEPDGYADPFTFRIPAADSVLVGNRGVIGVEGGGAGPAGRGVGGGAGADGAGGRQVGGGVEAGGANGRRAGGEGDAGGNQAGRQAAGGGNNGGVQVGGGVMVGEMAQAFGPNINVPPVQPLDAWSDGNCGMANPPVVTDTVAGGAFANGDTLSIGSFKMKLGDVTGTGAGLSGVGEINVSWLWTSIAVEFQNIKVNAGKQVFSGAVVGKVDSAAPQYPQQWAINFVGNMTWVKSLVKNVDKWLKQNGKIVTQLNQQVQALKLPIGVNNLKGYTLAISEMRFTKDSAMLSAVAAVPINSQNDTLGLRASKVPFGTGGVATKGRLDLLEDVTIAGYNSFDVIFRKRQGNRQGTWLQWNCSNFDTIALDLDVQFPRTWLVPSPDSDPTKKATATFRARVTDMENWIADANLPRSTVVGTNGLDVEVQWFTYDHSDGLNPQGLQFPGGYIGDTSSLFRGFFLKQATVYLPDKLRTYEDSTRRISIAVQNMIINKDGLTANMLAKNLLQYPKANIARLGASIDTVKIVMINSSLTSAYVRGLITLPISDTSRTNTLSYKALFSTVDTSFQFTLTPTGPLVANMFSNAKFTLDATSALALKLGKSSSFNLTMNGSFEWADIDIGPVKNVKLTTKFQGMKLLYTDAGGMSFDVGKWSFASPPKWIANFPVTIDNVKFTATPKQGTEKLRGVLGLEVIVNLDSNRVGGRTKLEVECAIDKPDDKWYRPKVVGVRIDSIGIYAKLPAVTLDGYVKFMQRDPMYGDGFKGYVKAAFNSAQIEVTATAMFGSTTYNSAEKYRYWYVDAKAILPPPGIVFLPGYAFYGFGAGAWRHISVSQMPKPDPAQIAASQSNSTATASGGTFIPDKNINFGFKMTAVVGTTPDPSKFNADVTLAGQFTNAGGMTFINFNGDIYGMAKLTERATAPVKGNININYDFTTKIFDLSATVNINKDPITTPNGVNAKVHVEGKTGIWYVKIGEPNARNTINVAGVNVESYFMFGKNITPPSGFSSATTNGLHAVGVWNFSPDAGATNNAISGNGFAAGVGLNFSTGDRDKSVLDRVKVRWRVGGGFEVNLSLLRYPNGTNCASGDALTGVNKWYTQGNMAAYAFFYCGIHIDPKGAPCLFCCKRNHENGCDYGIADIQLGAFMEGGFPKPTWLQGTGHGHFDLLDGLVRGDFTADFSYGTRCTPAGGAETTPGAVAQDVAAEQQSQLIKKIYPANNTYSFARTDRPRALYGFTPNETFDVVESQGGNNGATLNRTFQARYVVALRKKGANGQFGSPISIVTGTNPLGERIFGPNVPVQVQPPVNPLGRAMPNPVGPGLPAVQYNAQPRGMQNDPEPDLPPPPPVGGDMDSAAVYQLTVTATLYERNANGVWVVAKKRNGQDVADERKTEFSTAAYTNVVLHQQNNPRGGQ